MDFKTILLSVIYVIYGCIQVSSAFLQSIEYSYVGAPNGAAGNAVMNGWQIYNYGGIEGLQFNNQIPVPYLRSKHDVLIEVLTTAVNPLDQLMTVGFGRRVLNSLRFVNRLNEFPLILGREFCGIVRQKGSAVRQDIQVGQRVWGIAQAHQAGSLAEYVVVGQNQITHAPNGIDDIGAAGILFAGLTAWSSIFVSGLAGGIKGATTPNGGGSGKRICILGASGGVGTLAVQIAKAENMIVTATCSTNSIPLAKSLGADYIIDYKTENLVERFRGQTFDIILDSAGLGPDYASTLPWRFGQYITLAPPVLNNTDTNGIILGTIQSGFSLIKSNIRTIFGHKGLLNWGFFLPAPQGIEYLRRLVDSGRMRPIIDSVYELNGVKEAFRKVESGHLRGKVVVQMKRSTYG